MRAPRPVGETGVRQEAAVVARATQTRRPRVPGQHEPTVRGARDAAEPALLVRADAADAVHAVVPRVLVEERAGTGPRDHVKNDVAPAAQT